MATNQSENKFSFSNFDITPVTKVNWVGLVKLFGEKGASAGRWCMYWRLARKEFDILRGQGTRTALHKMAEVGQVPGLLANLEDNPAGWVSLGPREIFPVLERLHVLKRVDNLPVRSIVCFFIRRSYRRQGLTLALIQAAIRYTAILGASILEGYPIEPKGTHYPDTYAYTGLASTFRSVGFVEVTRFSPTRPIMRYEIGA